MILRDRSLCLILRPCCCPIPGGNNKLDSMSNVTERPRTALLFLVPGVLETLRVTGRLR
ncbi:MAG: hypothetical protein Ct9H300mP1_12840 [Planctomycetaceae bacterium]|nr:MAG: hypothetical protein Ct9H300mP1_12840 [Planctomycetaceae bacterium]